MNSTSLLVAALLASGLIAAAQPTRAIPPQFATVDAAVASAAPSAEDILKQAKTTAAAEHKNLLLVFSASWCGPCRMFEAFLEDPKAGPILAGSFVVARFDVGERTGDKHHSDTPGAEAYRATLGGANAGYPFLVMLDPAGRTIVNSFCPARRSPPGENIGYPATPAEIDWFMKMLQQAAPGISGNDARTLDAWLRQRGHS